MASALLWVSFGSCCSLLTLCWFLLLLVWGDGVGSINCWKDLFDGCLTSGTSYQSNWGEMENRWVEYCLLLLWTKSLGEMGSSAGCCVPCILDGLVDNLLMQTIWGRWSTEKLGATVGLCRQKSYFLRLMKKKSAEGGWFCGHILEAGRLWMEN